MGLFSIFWVREPRRPCGWPVGLEFAAYVRAQLEIALAAMLTISATRAVL